MTFCHRDWEDEVHVRRHGPAGVRTSRCRFEQLNNLETRPVRDGYKPSVRMSQDARRY